MRLSDIFIERIVFSRVSRHEKHVRAHYLLAIPPLFHSFALLIASFTTSLRGGAGEVCFEPFSFSSSLPFYIWVYIYFQALFIYLRYVCFHIDRVRAYFCYYISLFVYTYTFLYTSLYIASSAFISSRDMHSSMLERLFQWWDMLAESTYFLFLIFCIS